MSMPSTDFSRRRFLQGLAGLLAASQIDVSAAPAPAQSFRFAFVTDLHLLRAGALRSIEGIATCLQAVEELNPRPDFILVGGDLVNDTRAMPVAEAERAMDLFLKTWHKQHRPARLLDLRQPRPLLHQPGQPALRAIRATTRACSRNASACPNSSTASTTRAGISSCWTTSRSCPTRGMRDCSFDDELAFLQADLQTHAAKPTIVCTHIPLFSLLPFSFELAAATGFHVKSPKSLVCTNASAAVKDFPGHNIRAVLSGHLHRYEKNLIGNVPFYNSGAVCGNYWKGPMADCHEGYAVVDLKANGAVNFDYRGFGWKA